MTEPDVTVSITDTEFTLGELEDFIARARAVEGIALNALVVVKTPNVLTTTKRADGPIKFELSASSAYRAKS